MQMPEESWQAHSVGGMKLQVMGEANPWWVSERFFAGGFPRICRKILDDTLIKWYKWYSHVLHLLPKCYSLLPPSPNGCGVPLTRQHPFNSGLRHLLRGKRRKHRLPQGVHRTHGVPNGTPHTAHTHQPMAWRSNTRQHALQGSAIGQGDPRHRWIRFLHQLFVVYRMLGFVHLNY